MEAHINIIKTITQNRECILVKTTNSTTTNQLAHLDMVNMKSTTMVKTQ